MANESGYAYLSASEGYVSWNMLSKYSINSKCQYSGNILGNSSCSLIASALRSVLACVKHVLSSGNVITGVTAVGNIIPKQIAFITTFLLLMHSYFKVPTKQIP